MSNPSSQSMSCQVCGTQFTRLGQVTSIWDRLCLGCSQKQMVTKSSAIPVTQPKLQEKPQSELPSNESFGTGKPGVKDDGGKLRYDLLPWKAIDGLIRVLTFGARKYSPNGWRTVPNAKERYEAALLRHLSAIKRGEKIDPESGLRHIDHILCNVTFLAELED